MERKNSRNSGEKRNFKKDGDGGFGGGNRRGGSSSGHRPSRMSIPKGTEIDFKNIAFLQKCLTERGKVFSRRLTSASAKQQRLIILSVKRGRFLGLLPVGSSRKK